MNDEYQDIIKKYKDKWIALTPDEKRVIASSKYAAVVVKKAKKEKINSPIIFKVPSDSVGYIL